MTYSKRQQIILKTLMHATGYMTALNLANVCSSSEKTVRNEILEMNSTSNIFNIKSKKGYGYHICFNSKEDHALLEEQLLNMSKFKKMNDISNSILDFIASKLLKKDSHFYEAECIKKCYISSATFHKYIGKIKNELELYNLSISKLTNSYHITGDEKYIRNFIITRIKFNSATSSNEGEESFLIDSIDTDFIRDCISLSCKEYDLYITKDILNNLCIHICILIMRHTVDVLHPTLIKEDNPNYDLALSIYRKILKKYKLNENEVIEIMQYFICNAGSLEIKTDYEKYWEYEITTNEILNDIALNTDIDLRNDSTLIQALTMHLISMVNRILCGIEIKYEFDEELKKNYILAYSLAYIAKLRIENKFNIFVPTSEITLLAIHFCGSLQRIQKKSQLDLLIVSQVGISYANLLKEKIISTYKTEIDIDILSLYSFRTELANKYDYVICNIPLPSIKNSILIENFFTAESIKKIDDLLSEKQNQRIKKFFSRELFINDQNCYKNENEFIQYYGNEFVKLGLLHTDDLDQFHMRELSSSTYIGRAAAIPHILKPSGKSFCAIILLKNDVPWQNQNVRLVFFTCCTKKNVQIFSSLCKNIQFFLRKNEEIDPRYNNLTYEIWQEQLMHTSSNYTTLF